MRKSTKLGVLFVLCCLIVAILSVEAFAAKKSNKDYTIAVVPKSTNVAWFQRMEVGVKEYAKKHNLDVFYIGPHVGDAALQSQIIDDLIAQGVDAICVVPFSPEALEPVCKKARDAGIVVISHEAQDMVNVDYDIEAFDNDDYGRHLMEHLARAMGEKGDYILTVGTLTSTTHNQWVDAGKGLQMQKYPNMRHFGDKVETQELQNVSYNRIKEILTANPHITGMQGSAMADVVGAALAVQELGLKGKVKLVGTSLVSVAGKHIKDGIIDTISFWDPALAGQAMIEVALAVLNGEEIKEGMDLGVPGYNNLKKVGKNLLGEAWIDVNIDNVDDPAYNF